MLLIAYFGRIYPGKGIENLFLAFRAIADKYATARLYVIGGFLDVDSPVMDSTYPERIHNQTINLGIADKAFWTGEYDWDSDVGSCALYASDICVLPMSFGVSMRHSSLASAAMHGVPLVVTTSKETEPQLVHGENVWSVPTDDVNALAEGIEILITNPDLRRRLGNGALKLSHAWFSWEPMLDELEYRLSTKA